VVTRKTKKSTKLEPKEYHRILSSLKLQEIYLISSSVSLDRENLQKSLKISLNNRATYEQQEDRLKVTHKFFLKTDIPENQKEAPLKISATFRLTFISKHPLKKEFFEIFKQINLPLNSWPYFREFVQSTTQRMNIPPLTLPFFKHV